MVLFHHQDCKVSLGFKLYHLEAQHTGFTLRAFARAGYSKAITG